MAKYKKVKTEKVAKIDNHRAVVEIWEESGDKVYAKKSVTAKK